MHVQWDNKRRLDAKKIYLKKNQSREVAKIVSAPRCKKNPPSPQHRFIIPNWCALLIALESRFHQPEKDYIYIYVFRKKVHFSSVSYFLFLHFKKKQRIHYLELLDSTKCPCCPLCETIFTRDAFYSRVSYLLKKSSSLKITSSLSDSINSILSGV